VFVIHFGALFLEEPFCGLEYMRAPNLKCNDTFHVKLRLKQKGKMKNYIVFLYLTFLGTGIILKLKHIFVKELFLIYCSKVQLYNEAFIAGS